MLMKYLSGVLAVAMDSMASPARGIQLIRPLTTTIRPPQNQQRAGTRQSQRPSAKATRSALRWGNTPKPGACNAGHPILKWIKQCEQVCVQVDTPLLLV